MGHGAFTWSLLEGLCGKAADSDGDVSLLNLVAYTTKRTQRIAKEFSRKDQTPTMLGNVTDFVMVQKSKTSPEDLEKLLAKYREEAKKREEAIAKELAKARKYLEVKIQKMIEAEFGKADIKKPGLNKEIIQRILSVLVASQENDVPLWENFRLLLKWSSEEDIIKQLVVVPVNEAYSAALDEYRDREIEEEEERERERKAAEELRIAIAQFEKVYQAALKANTVDNFIKVNKITKEETPAGWLITHKLSGKQYLVPIDKYPLPAGTRHILDQDTLAGLRSRDMAKRDAAVKFLVASGITVKRNPDGEYVFSYETFEIEMKKGSDGYYAFQGVGKYLVNPGIAPKLIDLDIHKKMLALDKEVVKLLPQYGAKVIIHGMLFDRNPENKDCPFVSDEFKALCDYLGQNVDKLGLEKVVYNKHENSDAYTAAEMVNHAAGKQDPFVKRWTGSDITTDTDKDKMATGFIFDRIVQKTDGTGDYKYSMEDNRVGGKNGATTLSGQTLYRHRRDLLSGNQNPYLNSKYRKMHEN